MIGCPNCGNQLKFDIKSQKMKCDYCDSQFEVDEVEKIRQASEVKEETKDFLNVYGFTCPQCGGVIYGDRQDLTGFCSYCGTHVELNGRLTKIEKPEYIIPFKKTKEDCKKIFKRKVSKALFVPKEFKDKAHIDSFRGIYMPYSVYTVKHDGKFDLYATGSSYRRGDYVYRKKYSVEGRVKGSYTGFEHDVSSTFSNDISEALAPFKNQERVPFKEGYVSGFYADAKDEQASLYEDKAKSISLKETLHAIDKEMSKKKRFLELDKSNKLGNHNIVSLKSEKGLYPVWFMSYRAKNRVAYAAVNGQTGKIAADLPIDFKKFFIFSLILAIPLYFVFDNIFYLMPKTMVGLFAVFSSLFTSILNLQMNQIMLHDNISYELEKEEQNAQKQKQKKNDKRKTKLYEFLIYLFLVVAIILIASHFWVVLLGYLVSLGLVAKFCFYSLIYVAFIFYQVNRKHKILKHYDVDVKGTSGIIALMMCLCLGIFVGVMNFASDLYYWILCLALLCSLILFLFEVVLNHNMVVTRRPVQFNKHGGDDRA